MMQCRVCTLMYIHQLVHVVASILLTCHACFFGIMVYECTLGAHTDTTLHMVGALYVGTQAQQTDTERE